MHLAKTTILSLSVVCNVILLVAVSRSTTPSASSSPKVASAQSGAKQNPWDFMDLSASEIRSNLMVRGWPEAEIKAILRAHVLRDFDRRMALLVGKKPQSALYWKMPLRVLSAATRLKQLELMRERSWTLERLEVDNVQSSIRLPVSDDKQRRLNALLNDYRTLTDEISQESGHDIEADALHEIEERRKAEIADMLNPQELADFNRMESSTYHALIAGRLFGITVTEDEFRHIYDLRKIYEDRYVRRRPGAALFTMEEYARAEAEYEAGLASVLGPDRYRSTVLATQPEFADLSKLLVRMQMPAAALERVYAIRSDIEKRANEIFDAHNNESVRATALKKLAEEAKASITHVLGPELSRSYIKSASWWLDQLETGGAFTTQFGGGYKLRR